MSNADWKPTTRLRFVERDTVVPTDNAISRTLRILQQWHAPDVPGYMRGSEGEWRDVPVESEA